MIKFLFYLFIFYVVYRYVFGGFKVKVFHYHQNTPPPPTRDHYQEEGKITSYNNLRFFIGLLFTNIIII
jgi:hypothetical protein